MSVFLLDAHCFGASLGVQLGGAPCVATGRNAYDSSESSGRPGKIKDLAKPSSKMVSARVGDSLRYHASANRPPHTKELHQIC